LESIDTAFYPEYVANWIGRIDFQSTINKKYVLRKLV
jgi:hypothetical protein